MSVLVFDEDPDLTLVEAPDVEVLVFDGDTDIQQVPGDETTEFLLFDTEAPVVEEVTQPPDFLLVDTPVETVAENVDGLDDLLVFSAPPGPKGDPGIPGEGAVYLEYNFAIPTTTWVIPHNLDTFALTVETVVGGEVVEGDVQYVDDDTITVEWYYPMTGTARVFK